MAVHPSQGPVLVGSSAAPSRGPCDHAPSFSEKLLVASNKEARVTDHSGRVIVRAIGEKVMSAECDRWLSKVSWFLLQPLDLNYNFARPELGSHVVAS